MKDLRERLSRPGHPDYWLMGAVAALLIIGLNMVYSASFVIAHNSPVYRDESYFVARQAFFILLGLIAIAVLMQIDYRVLRRLSAVGMIAVIVLLVVVVLPGVSFNINEYGAQRWIKVGPIQVQPSELAKLAIVVFFADWLARKGEHVAHLSYGSIPFAIILSIICGLIMLQPDLGTTIVVGMTAVAVFFIAGADVRHFLLGVALSVTGIWFLIHSAAYRASRLAAFLDPESDPLGRGWHILQSTIAIGSGGLFGVGLGASRQKHYYLFGAHTDVIFAVIAEETGLIGALVVLALFGVVAFRGYKITRNAPDTFGALLAAGITCSIVFQALINIAVVVGVVPFTGITLPFLSYGGSSLLVLLIGVGILLSVSCRSRRGDEATVEPVTAYPAAPILRPRAAPLPRRDGAGRAYPGVPRRPLGPSRPYTPLGLTPEQPRVDLKRRRRTDES